MQRVRSLLVQRGESSSFLGRAVIMLGFGDCVRRDDMKWFSPPGWRVLKKYWRCGTI